MKPDNQTASDLLGYRIEQVVRHADRECEYRVFCPVTAEVLGHFPDQPSAHRFILQRELQASSARPRHPAY